MASEATVSYRVELLGPFRLIRGDRITTRLQRQKAAHLLAYLALQPHHAHPREQLIDLLWPEYAPEAGRDSLNTTLSYLRKELTLSGTPEGVILASGRDTIGLSSPPLTIDISEFDSLLQRAAGMTSAAERIRLREQAHALYRGDLLDGWYADWVLTARRLYRERYLSALIALAQDLKTLQQWPAAQQAAQRAIEIDSLSEEATLVLMRALARQGQANAALAAFRRLEHRLRTKMDAEPKKELRDLKALLIHDPEALRLPQTAHQTKTPEVIPSGNLPERLTSFLGRQQERIEIKRLLAHSRLLTLTGTGGCGKTSLAVEIGKEIRSHYPDGVWMVELAALTDPLRVADAVARVLNVTEQAGQPMSQTLIRALADKQLLLILDNCEHLVEACAYLAELLLSSCARLHLLATSREPLAIAGEQLYRVPALTLPPTQQAVGVEALSEYSATALFVERAQLVKSDFRVTEAQAWVLVEICRRLDGIPLAIELAAARVGLLTLEDLHRWLDNRFILLRGGSRTVLPRQQTLRALIDWSYDLLNEAEREMFARLSVFAGGWTLEAAEAVCAGVDVLALLGSLVSKSLVLTETEGDTARYRMLESLREFAAEQLRHSGEASMVNGRHAAYYAELAHRAAPCLKSADMKIWLARLDQEQGNLRAAIGWYLRSKTDGEAGLQLCNDLYDFWRVRGYWAEGRAHLHAARAHPGVQQATLVRATICHKEASLEYETGNHDDAISLYHEALAIYRAIDDQYGIADTLNGLGLIMYYRRDMVRARAFFEEQLTILRRQENRRRFGEGLFNLSLLAMREGKVAEARALVEECLQIAREHQTPEQIASILSYLGNVAMVLGDDGEAEAAYREALAICRDLNIRQGIATILNNLATAFIARNALALARPLLEESLAICRELNSSLLVAIVLPNIAVLEAEQGNMTAACSLWQEGLTIGRELGLSGTSALMHMAHAAYLRGNWELALQRYGAVEAHAELDSLPHWPSRRRLTEAEWAIMKAQLGAEAFQRAFDRGAAMDLVTAITQALAEEQELFAP